MAKNKNIDALNSLAEEMMEAGDEEAAEKIKESTSAISEQLHNLGERQKKEAEKEKEPTPSQGEEKEDKPKELSQQELIEAAAKAAVSAVRAEDEIAKLATDLNIDPFVAQSVLSAKPESFEGTNEEFLKEKGLGKQQAQPFESTSEFAVPKTQEEKDELFKKEDIEAKDFLTKNQEVLDKLAEQEGGEQIVEELTAEHYDAQARARESEENITNQTAE